MTLEEMMKALEAVDNGSEMAEVVKGLQAEIAKKNSEAKNLRERMKTSESALAANKETLKKVVSKLGLELQEDDEGSLDEALEGFMNGRKPSSEGEDKELAALRLDMQRMKRDFEKMQKAKEQSDQLAAAEREKRIGTEKARRLTEALTSEKAISPTKLVKLLEGNVKVLEDDSMVYVGDDGAEVDLKEGVASFLKANPEFVANNQVPGSGGGKGAGAGGQKLYSKAELEAMTPEEVNKNWDAVQASMAALD